MSTSWRWVAISPELKLTLTLDSSAPELIERVEASAKANGIVLERIDPEEPAPPPDLSESLE